MAVDGVQGANCECEHRAGTEEDLGRTGHHTRLHLGESGNNDGEDAEGDVEDAEEDGEEDSVEDEEKDERG